MPDRAPRARKDSAIYIFIGTWSVVFAATLAIGVWASYSLTIAAPRVVALAAGAALVAVALAIRAAGGRSQQAARVIDVTPGLLASLAAALIGGAWLAFPDRVNANVAAAAVVALLPFALAAILSAVRRRAYLPAALSALLALPALACLILSDSRGAWLGIGAAAAVVALLAALGDKGRRPAVAATLAALLTAAPLAVLAGALLRPDLAAALSRVGGADMSRPALWAAMLEQLADVPFTGSGLGATMMNDATYVRLLHVGGIAHAHHLYLQIALEQGLLGLAAFAAIQAAALYAAIRAGALAAVAALTALLVHGSVDAGLYVARDAMLLFFPAATALLLAGPHVRVASSEAAPAWPRFAFAPVLLCLLLPTVRATLQANIGAVLQARAELGVYNWPSVPIQDALRRDPSVDLAPAIARFEAALALDPTNRTAHRRLGQIALARGDYRGAQAHLQAALQREQLVGWGERAPRQLLGELHAIAGDTRGATRLWQGLDLGQGQLGARQYWYESIGEPARAAAVLAAEETISHAY